MKENNRALTGANKCFEPEYLQKTLVQEKEKKLSSSNSQDLIDNKFSPLNDIHFLVY